MGMKQKKCPLCKKRRRFVEGHQKIGRTDEHGREDGWRMVGDLGLICGPCIKRLEKTQ